jgi:hypothetical protein
MINPEMAEYALIPLAVLRVTMPRQRWFVLPGPRGVDLSELRKSGAAPSLEYVESEGMVRPLLLGKHSSIVMGYAPEFLGERLMVDTEEYF